DLRVAVHIRPLEPEYFAAPHSCEVTEPCGPHYVLGEQCGVPTVWWTVLASSSPGRAMPMSTKPIVGRVRKTYEFIKAHRSAHSVQMMCHLLGVAPSGYYEWLKKPMSNRAQEDARLLRLIRASFEASQGVYGAPRVFLDLREAGETCSKHRVARL